MIRRGVIALLVGGASIALTGCGVPTSASYRFRMTVEVETPQGLRSGSSVMEVRIARGLPIGDLSGVSSDVRGEAVVVDLPDGPLFVLLKLPDAGPSLQTVVGDALRGRRAETPDAAMIDTAALGSAPPGAYKADLPHHLPYSYGSVRHPELNVAWPMMVRFKDLSDPKSVERVDPDAIGVRRIRLETTTAPVTTGIAKRLAWLVGLRGSYLSGQAVGDGTALGLYGGLFSTEVR